jgi:phosphatidylglycerophosphate synthase
VTALLKRVNRRAPGLGPARSRAGRCGRVPAVMRPHALAATIAALALSLLLAAPALAGEGGEGLYGKADDKVVTNFGYGLMIFFVLFVTVLSIGQYLLERRKRSK